MYAPGSRIPGLFKLERTGTGTDAYRQSARTIANQYRWDRAQPENRIHPVQVKVVYNILYIRRMECLQERCGCSGCKPQSLYLTTKHWSFESGTKRHQGTEDRKNTDLQAVRGSQMA